MAMNADERRRVNEMLTKDFIEVSKSEPANMAVFYDEHGTIHSTALGLDPSTETTS